MSQASTIAELRARLRRLAAQGTTITYQALATELKLEPPNTIHQLTTLLEDSMREDAQANRPFIAALVVSKRPPYLPRPGFFLLATELGRFSGNDGEAAEFHARELDRCRSEFHSDKTF
jgi:hypothetical protein